MEDHRNEERQNTKWDDRAPSATTRWLVIVSVTLFAIVIFAVGYAYERASAASALIEQNRHDARIRNANARADRFAHRQDQRHDRGAIGCGSERNAGRERRRRGTLRESGR